MKVSVVVPVLNEEAGLPDLLAHLQTLACHGAEVMFVDGGSTDTTVALITQAGFNAISTNRGRAHQMNAGVAHTSGEVLLFLHSDTRLPEGWWQHVVTRLQGPTCWGRFDVRISGRSTMLRVVAAMMNWRSRLSGIATGDQAMFMTRQAFASVGGFVEQPLMEDVEMSRRLKRLSRPACLAHKVTTSGRRWETRGVWATIFLMWRLRWAYWRGQPASQLAKAYL
jgi:rSAM/selenodomain-associated transferase 2